MPADITVQTIHVPNYFEPLTTEIFESDCTRIGDITTSVGSYSFSPQECLIRMDWDGLPSPRYWESSAADVRVASGALGTGTWAVVFDTLPDGIPGGSNALSANSTVSSAFDHLVLESPCYVAFYFNRVTGAGPAAAVLDGCDIVVTWTKTDRAAFKSSPVPLRRFGGWRKRSTSRPAALYLN